jgi:hypothetical protein
VRSTFVNMDALDQLLLQRFGGKVGEFSNRLEFCAAPVLTGYSGKDESSAETGHNGKCKQKYAVERREYRECGPDPWPDVGRVFRWAPREASGLPGEGGA